MQQITVHLLLAATLVLLHHTNAYISLLRSTSRVTVPQSMSKGKAAAEKVRVRLLVDVKGTGQKNDILMIGASVYLNSLLPKKQAEKITDEQFKKLEENAKVAAAQKLGLAGSCGEKIAAEAAVVQVKMKIGKEGKLFGSISLKAILASLRSKVPLIDSLDEKEVKLIELKDEKGADLLKAGEIRTAGAYACKVQLHPAIAPQPFIFEIVSE